MGRSIRRVLFSLVVLALATPVFAYDVVNTSWTVVCLFSPSCSVPVTDYVSEFAVSGGSGNGKLQSRIYQAQAGSTAAGKWVYEYRINMGPVAGIVYPPYVNQLAISNWGAVRTYDYNGNGIVTDDVFNITSGGIGTKAVTSSYLTAPWTYFVLSSPVYAGSYPGGGESSYFFGLVSDQAPVLRTMWVHTDSGWVAVTGYAPPV
ncbi:MAG TPA: hypothetical protein VF618_14905 [Thermoanaerobaculia bacterium]